MSLALHPAAVTRPGSVGSSLACCGWFFIAFVGNCLRNHTLEGDKKNTSCVYILGLFKAM